ncbi:unnamed protein product [Lota lota]
MPIKHLVLLEFIICAVSAGLPKPVLKMDAVNTKYLLRWNWTYSTSVNFTAQMAFSNTASYKDICFGVETYCDYSAHLDYSGEYYLRVQAETRGDRSDWAMWKFCPDADAPLGAPSELRVEAGVSMLIVSFKEPMAENGEPMSAVLSQNSMDPAMAFRLMFWTDDAPSQRQEKKLNTTAHTLSLNAHTRYCLQVQAFSDAFAKTSPYTLPLCTTTLGPTLFWNILFPLLLFLVLLGVFGFLWTRKRWRMFQVYALPSSIVLDSKSHQPLLVPMENTCPVTALVAMPTAEQVPPFSDRPAPAFPTARTGDRLL